jgi:hypothetical protein
MGGEPVISSGADVTEPCGDCGSTMHCGLVQRILDERLQWSIEGRCSGCGAAFCTFGWDDTPTHVREALIAAGGLARLTVELAEGTSRMAVLKVFRESGASLADAQASAERALTTGIEGTSVELELLARRLRKKGVPAVIRS